MPVIGRVKRKPKTLVYVDAEGLIHERPATGGRKKAKPKPKRPAPTLKQRDRSSRATGTARSIADALLAQNRTMTDHQIRMFAHKVMGADPADMDRVVVEYHKGKKRGDRGRSSRRPKGTFR